MTGEKARNYAIFRAFVMSNNLNGLSRFDVICLVLNGFIGAKIVVNFILWV